MTLRNERTEEVRHVEFRASEDADGQTLEGYAVVFNQWTNIRDRQGEYREQILQGATKRTLGQRMPVMQFDHGSHPLLGSLPLGVYSVAREDKNGVFVRGRMSDNWLVEPFRDAIRDHAVTGMSVRMRVVDDEWGVDAEGNDTRTIKEIEILEMGPVVFPAYTTTAVAVRSLMGAMDGETRAALAAELGTSPVAEDPAVSDSPDEPPVVSHETPRNRLYAALTRAGKAIPTDKEQTDVDP